ncbi:DNA polymerase-3 subunit delta [Catalinimonas alkaloidigena]|uniref:DNA polymerase III subunit delta n=1 Tax=Catalinimonas alkaloidigena TaxID=1075417 RepID=UPI0024056C75|nr:DNA polymerase III subunit delta [Catalinimonas alkaloidigena]MDF9795524.1 DNA polymerase-3 subunit delta [Catalinimonas alkaloidigena]
MPHTPESVLKSLREKQYAPLYFLQGEEPYHIDLIADYIEENVLEESERGFNQIIMYGKDVDVSTVLNNAKRYPMMSERQVVIVREAQEVQDLNAKGGQQQMEAYVKNPMPSTILVFCYKYKTIDGRKPLSKLLDKFGVLVESKKMYDNQLPDWIAQYIKQKGFQIDDKAVQMLADYIGNNLKRLTNEIEKVLINFRQGDEEGEITPAVIQKYIGISKEYNVFELQKALAVRDVLKANRIIQYFEANQKANPIIPVIALLFTFFSKLLLVHQSSDKSERALAGVLKINPFFAKEYKIAAVNYPLPKVIANIHHLRMADQHAKGIDNSAGNDAQIMKELVFRLMH